MVRSCVPSEFTRYDYLNPQYYSSRHIVVRPVSPNHELNASVLSVLHTSPESPRLLADILGRCRALKVEYGQHKNSIKRGHAYIAPPDHHMTMLPPGVIRLDQGPKVRFSRPAVDPLFRTAAEVEGPRVIGVVLTDYGEDGTDGLWEIKVAGGVCVVQDPDDATASEMPRRALIRNREAFKIPVHEMATLLVPLVNGESVRVV